jgi:transcriptional regulator with XRE-family HTH domain
MLFSRVKKQAELRGISLVELAKQCGLTRSSFDNWKTSTPSADKLYKVAKYLNVPLEYFLEESANVNTIHGDVSNSTVNMGGYQAIDKGVQCGQNCDVLEKYRRLSLSDQKTITDMIEYLLSKSEKPGF